MNTNENRIVQWDELALHSTSMNLWILIDGRVYDVTSYQAEHPGGDDVLIQYGGMDASKKFTSINHSVYALSLRDARLVGIIEDGPVPVSYQEKMNDIKKQNKKVDKNEVMSWHEIAKHNKPTDLWMAIDGKVYDVTEFQDEHPGGPSILLSQAGKDASQKFKAIGHSEGANKQMAQYQVGVVNGLKLQVENKRDNRVFLVAIGILLAILYKTFIQK